MLKSGGNADCKPANSTNGSRGDFVRNSRTRNETEQRKGVEKVAGEQQKDADDDSERWKIIEKSRKQRDDRSKYVPSAAKGCCTSEYGISEIQNDRFRYRTIIDHEQSTDAGREEFFVYEKRRM